MKKIDFNTKIKTGECGKKLRRRLSVSTSSTDPNFVEFQKKKEKIREPPFSRFSSNKM